MQLNKETVEIDNLIRNINQLLNKYTKKQLSHSRLTLPRFYTLWFISKLEPVNMSKLNEKIMVSKSTLTVTVDHLVEEGFVTRDRDDNDRRIVLLKTTTKGKIQLQDLLVARQIFFQNSLESINIKEQKQIINLLEIIMGNLKDNYQDYKKGNIDV